MKPTYAPGYASTPGGRRSTRSNQGCCPSSRTRRWTRYAPSTSSVGKTPHGAHANDGKPYSATYLRTLNNQLTAILNHAERYYGLSSNPAMRTVKMGGKEARTMNFWTKDEYLRFSDATMDAPRTFVIFEVLYWTGIREGELLALTPDSFDWKKSTIAGLATVCWTVS